MLDSVEHLISGCNTDAYPNHIFKNSDGTAISGKVDNGHKVLVNCLDDLLDITGKEFTCKAVPALSLFVPDEGQGFLLKNHCPLEGKCAHKSVYLEMGHLQSSYIFFEQP